MTNEEKYKTAILRIEAFRHMCHSSPDCLGCKYNEFYKRLGSPGCLCAWLEEECEVKEKADLPFKVVTDNGMICIVGAKSNCVVCGKRGMTAAESACERMNAVALAWHDEMRKKEKECLEN